MSRFKRLTDAEARTLTRGELLDRIEVEQAYWFRKGTHTAQDDAAFREFTRIMHAYISPSEAIQDTIDYIEGRSSGNYWNTHPGEETPKPPPMDATQRAGLNYARRVFGIGGRGTEMPEREAGQ
ncbi:MAG: hypothetical protein ACRDNF_03065 [Streptosporangiaceae bacterium]